MTYRAPIVQRRTTRDPSKAREKRSLGIAPKALGTGVSRRHRKKAQVVQAVRIWDLVRAGGPGLVCDLIIGGD
jgi:hypothetical protein